jgi:hypothetical protein
MLWRIPLILISLIALLIGYYWVHKPFDLPLAQTLFGLAQDVLTTALIAGVAGGFVRRVAEANNIRFAPLSRAERVAVEGVIGLFILSLVALLLGFTNSYRASTFFAILFTPFLLAFRSIITWYADVLGAVRAALREPSPLILPVGFLLVTGIAQAFAPPVGWDGLMYHLISPQRYLAAHGLVTATDNHLLGFPQGMEILFGVGMSLFGRDTAAAPLHALFGLLGLLALGGVVHRYTDARTAWIAVAFIAVSESVWILFGKPYVDLAAMAYGAVALSALTAWRESRHRRWIVLMGIFAGAAVGVKYTAIGLLPALAFYVLVQGRGSSFRIVFRDLAILGIAAFLVFLPWMIKGAVYYGNPVYPFFFGGVSWDAFRSADYSGAGGGYLQTGRVLELLTLPIYATVFGLENAAGLAFTAGAWLFAAWLLLIPAWRELRGNAFMRDLIILLIPLLIFWYGITGFTGTGGQTRLMMMSAPIFAAAGAVAVYGIGLLPRKPVDMGFIVRGAVTVTLAVQCLTAASVTVAQRIPDYFTANLNREGFITHNLRPYDDAMRRLSELPDGSRVLFLWEPRQYYCPPNIQCTADVMLDYWHHALQLGSTPADVFAAYRESHDYLLILRPAVDFFSNDARIGALVSQFDPETRMQRVWVNEFGYELWTW